MSHTLLQLCWLDGHCDIHCGVLQHLRTPTAWHKPAYSNNVRPRSWPGFPAQCSGLLARSGETQARPSLGILGALGCVTVCYMLMSAVLVMMPVEQVELGAPFACRICCSRLRLGALHCGAGRTDGSLTTTWWVPAGQGRAWGCGGARL